MALSDVLLYKYPPRMILEESGCFDPHHAIIVYKNGRAEFIDVCFRCMKHIASSGFTKIDIRKDKILKLYNYFEKLGFKYEMGEEL